MVEVDVFGNPVQTKPSVSLPNVTILVLSCDKNKDLFEPFYHCMEKYWPNHPPVIYKTETIINPYYQTIRKNFPIEQWTRGIREALWEITTDQVLLMVDDCFIRRPVNVERLLYASTQLTGNIACMNLEKAFDPNDLPADDITGFRKRAPGAPYAVSLMCGLWQREKLMIVLAVDSDPWEVEYAQRTYGFDYLINDGNYIIDWGYRTYKHVGLKKGKWCRETAEFFKRERVNINYNNRGFYD